MPTELKKYFYRLLCPGKTTHIRPWNGTMQKLDEPWNVAYAADPKYVVADSEENACAMIRNRLHNKWSGFQLMGSISLEEERAKREDELQKARIELAKKKYFEQKLMGKNIFPRTTKRGGEANAN